MYFRVPLIHRLEASRLVSVKHLSCPGSIPVASAVGRWEYRKRSFVCMSLAAISFSRSRKLAPPKDERLEIQMPIAKRLMPCDARTWQTSQCLLLSFFPIYISRQSAFYCHLDLVCIKAHTCLKKYKQFQNNYKRIAERVLHCHSPIYMDGLLQWRGHGALCPRKKNSKKIETRI